VIPKTGRCICVFFLVVVLTGCGSSSGTMNVSVSPSPAFVGSAQTLQFTASVSGDASGVAWSVEGSSGGTIDSNGLFMAPAVTQNATATITATSERDSSKSASVTVNIIAPGTVTSTNNPQVALYSISPPSDAKVSVQFGTGTGYGLTTWTQSTPSGGGPVSIYVAGMRANTLYHMRAVVQFSDGATVNDADHSFTTAALSASILPTITASTGYGMTPQPGVELLDFFTDSKVPFAITDLAGNVLWADNTADRSDLNPVKLLSNGHFLENFGGAMPTGSNSLLREIDLGGNVIWQMSAADLNQALASASCTGCNITVVGTHHDFAALPNGHIIVIASEQKVESGLTGYSSPVTVSGDVVIDLDQNHKPVWLWSEFDHLDLNRHPMGFPDWTHTNAVVYSPDDGDLIISIRHQHWVMKIDYDDGKGTGDILWKLGWQGDFALQNGTDPVDWQYAQHDANVISANSSGVLQMTLFDNGDNRVLDSSGDTCGAGTTACHSRIPIFRLDETAKTASLEWVDNLSPVYSSWGGSARLLGNDDIEFAECSLGVNSAIYEVSKTSSPQIVWQMQITGANAYRGFRLPSPYPGVQW
jgi:arylsulfate sulfotransferase